MSHIVLSNISSSHILKSKTKQNNMKLELSHVSKMSGSLYSYLAQSLNVGYSKEAHLRS